MTMTIADIEHALKATPTDPATIRRFVTKLKEGPEQRPGFGPCILWTRATTDKGYGEFKAGGGKVVAAHTWLWTRLNGPVPDGYQLDHKCHHWADCPGGVTCPHRPCVIHLEPATAHENILRGSGFAARQARQDVCEGKWGPHDLRDPKNIYNPPGTNERHCKACNLRAAAEYRQRKRELRARARDDGQRDIGQLTLL